MAVLSDKLEMVMTLIRRGADVNAPSGPSVRQTTALHVACFRGNFYHSNLDVVRFLVEHGADLYHADCDGMDAMKIAAVRGEAATLEYLIQV